MNIIVTGGAGFIGSNFVYYQLENHPEDRIICLDKLTYAGNLSTLEAAMKLPNFRFVKADIADRKAVEQLFEEEKPADLCCGCVRCAKMLPSDSECCSECGNERLIYGDSECLLDEARLQRIHNLLL